MKSNKADIIYVKDNFRTKPTGDGKHGPFYNKSQKWEFKLERSLFENAVWQGYLDACRTFRGIKHTAENRLAFARLANSYYED